MNDKKHFRMNLVAVLIFVTTAIKTVEKVISGGNRMEMTVTELVKSVIEIGITPALLLVFVYYFLTKSKDDDMKVKKAYEESQQNVKNAYEDAQRKIEETNKIIRDREDILIANNTRREEMIRTEAEKRENIIRKEAEKRESILMCNMERMVNSMDAISRSLNKMEGAFSKVEDRLEDIELKIGQGGNQ